MNKNVLDNICFYDVETTGIPSKGAKWDEDFETFPNIVVFRKNQSQYMVLLS
mgnify:CR=1 FL=1